MVASVGDDTDGLRDLEDSYGRSFYENLGAHNKIVDNDIQKQVREQEKSASRNNIYDQSGNSYGNDQADPQQKTNKSSPGDSNSDAQKPLSKPKRLRGGLRTIGSSLVFGNRRGIKKWLIIGGVPAFSGVLLFAILLFILAGLLKIPNLAANIETYEFARLVRQVGEATDRAVNEKLATETTDPTLYKKVADSFRGIRDGWDQKFLKQFSPRAAIRVLQSNSGFQLNYKPDAEKSELEKFLGKETLESVSLDGKTFDVVPQRGLLRSFIPKFIDLPYLADQAVFASDFAPRLSTALQEQRVNTIIRSFTARQLRRELGINLIAWKLGDYLGKDFEQARLIAEKQAYDKINRSTATETKTPALQEVEQEIVDETNEAVANPQELEKALKNNGVPAAVEKTLASSFNDSVLKEVTSALNPAYAIALPSCMIYDGSIEQASPSINASAAAEQAAFYFVGSAADQLKESKGNWQELLTAAGATGDKIGDYTQSNIYRQSTGQSINTDTTSISVEAGPLGYTLLDAVPFLGGSGVAKAVNGIAGGDPTTGFKGVCPYFTDLKVALISGVILQIGTILADGPTVGGATEADIAIEAGVQGTTKVVAKSLAQRFAEAFIGKQLSTGAVLGKAREMLAQGVTDFVKIESATLLAKFIVTWRASQFTNGLELKSDFVNEADSGGNIQANELARRRGGRPLACSELEQTGQADKHFLAAQTSRQSLVDRYLAVSNPNSLLNHTAMMIYGQFNGVLSRPFANTFSIFSGPFSLSTIFSGLLGISYASGPCSSQYYGNVQFGWSEPEEQLIDSSSSYLPLENQQLLDQSGKEDEIAQTYASCFGYSYNNTAASLDPTDPDTRLQIDVSGPGSMGELLSSGSIVRTIDGDVIIDKGLCAPQNLGINNPTYRDLVFRWRLALSYQTAVNQVTNLQGVTN